VSRGNTPKTDRVENIKGKGGERQKHAPTVTENGRVWGLCFEGDLGWGCRHAVDCIVKGKNEGGRLMNPRSTGEKEPQGQD